MLLRLKQRDSLSSRHFPARCKQSLAPAARHLSPTRVRFGPSFYYARLEVFRPRPLGEDWGEGLSPSRFAPSPNPSQREGKKPLFESQTEVRATFYSFTAVRRLWR